MHQKAPLNEPRGALTRVKGCDFIGPRQKRPVVIGKAVYILPRQEPHHSISAAFGQALSDASNCSLGGGDAGGDRPSNPLRFTGVKFFVEPTE